MVLRTLRSRVLGLSAVVAGVTLALAGCSAPADSTSSTPSADGLFPATIDTAYGEVTVAEKPERILVLSTTYIELLPYLDETPIASVDDDETIESYSPWLVGTERGEIDPNLLDADWQPAPEAIAAWEPDLILTDIWNTDEQLYAQLSQIAPTYVGIETDTQTSWQAHLGAIATLTGHDPAVVTEVEDNLAAEFAAVAETLPGLQGATYVIPVFFTDNQFWPTEYGNDPLIALGLVPGERQPHGDVTSADVETISQENIEVFTDDVVIFAASGAVSSDVIDETYASLQKDPRVAALPASANGTLLYLTGAEWIAINGGTPQSYLWWLERVAPTLQASALNTAAQ